MKIQLKQVLETTKCSGENTLYISAAPEGDLVQITTYLENDNRRVDTVSDDIKSAEGILLDHPHIRNLIRNVENMYFPLAKKICIRFFAKKGFYKYDQHSIADNLMIHDISIDGIKTLYPTIGDMIPGVEVFEAPKILYVNRVSKIMEKIEEDRDFSIDNPYSNRHNVIVL